MKFFHISDLHIGKMLNGYSLLESQKDSFSQILKYAAEEKPDAVLVCGDIYDKSVPSGEAYTLFDWFLSELSEACPETEILIIAGNHDSPERLSYGASFLSMHRIHISTVPPASTDEFLTQVTLSDEWGPVHFYLVPFIRPGHVRHLFNLDDSESLSQQGTGSMTTNSYTHAFKRLLEREIIEEKERNVILAHQFFTYKEQAPQTCDSETSVLTSGGLDAIDVSVLDAFDYAALGHIHGAQKVGKECFRYSGTPYKYSVSEEHHQKGITVVEMQEKGKEITIRRLPITCHPDVRRLKGTLEELKVLSDGMERSLGTAGKTDTYVSITLTDNNERYDFRERLEEMFAHILEIRVENDRTKKYLEEEPEENMMMTPLEAFSAFYEAVRHCKLTSEQKAILRHMAEEAEEEERT